MNPEIRKLYEEALRNALLASKMLQDALDADNSDDAEDCLVALSDDATASLNKLAEVT